MGEESLRKLMNPAVNTQKASFKMQIPLEGLPH